MSTPQAESGYPWHFKVLAGAAALYLGIRLVQVVVSLVEWVT